MKKRIIILSISLMLLSTLFGLVMHLLFMAYKKNMLLHSILMGSLFGLILSFFVTKFYDKYSNEKSIRTHLETTIRIDSLTQLYNRKAFDYDIRLISSESKYSMLFIDIDDFGELNNNHGHQTGDDVLRVCGVIVKECIRQTDSAYRYGGDELVVLLADCGKDEAEAIAKRILERSNSDKTLSFSISLSIGIASMPDDVKSISRLVNACDYAMLAAKQNGKNQIYLYQRTGMQSPPEF